jgi:hypothetical protein
MLGMALLRSGGTLFLPPDIRAAEVISPMTAEEALTELMAGNKRFVQSLNDSCVQRTPDRRMEVAEGQNPFAVILACADSRVSPEILFDQWIGDLFVVRVAGNIVSPTHYGILGYRTVFLRLYKRAVEEVDSSYTPDGKRNRSAGVGDA